MQSIVSKMVAKCGALTASQKTRQMKIFTNQEVYDKTPLQMFVAIERALWMTTMPNPEVVFRTHLPKTMKGIRALHTACGEWIDTSPNTVDNWGLSIAANCVYLRSNFYTKETSKTGCVSYTVAPVGVWTGKKKPVADSPVGTPIFDYIRLLWPSIHSNPSVDQVKMVAALDAMQGRANEVHVLEIAGFETVFGIKDGNWDVKLGTDEMVKVMEEIEMKDHFNSRIAFSNLSYIGTEELHGELKTLVDAADKTLIPWLEAVMHGPTVGLEASVCV
ncbi:hypothetical protein T484DRAFT_1758518 [Baffinella frigidus]|nr:hypothetical protein T484DRAFT_1758518 [Cryptophyta sp. CCMP2293]